MAANTDYIKQFQTKFHELQLAGLEQYALYLKQQLKLSDKRDNWEAYNKYIQKEIERNDKLIQSTKEKIK